MRSALKGNSVDRDSVNTVLSVYTDVCRKSSIRELDLIKITSVLKRFGVLDQSKYDHLLLKYSSFKGSYEDKLLRYLEDILPFVTLTDLALVLSDAGYRELCDSLLSMRNHVMEKVPNRCLPHAKEVHTFYVTLKKCADDDAFEFGSKAHLKLMISRMCVQLRSFNGSSRKQLVCDKLVALFFLLAKQYSDIKDRASVFQRLRRIMPRDVDRTTFDAVFHSHMALNWAIKGDVSAADKHERLARLACDNCSPCLATLAMGLNTQCKNNRLFYESHNKDYLDRAYVDFEKNLQCSAVFSDDERKLWNTISTLEMSLSLLGINLYLEVCDIESIDTTNIERARVLLDHFEEPSDCRRRMFYKLAKGRLHETSDVKLSEAYVREALTLAPEGCYKDVENVNIQNYLQFLVSKQLPSPFL